MNEEQEAILESRYPGMTNKVFTRMKEISDLPHYMQGVMMSQVKYAVRQLASTTHKDSDRPVKPHFWFEDISKHDIRGNSYNK